MIQFLTGLTLIYLGFFLSKPKLTALLHKENQQIGDSNIEETLKKYNVYVAVWGFILGVVVFIAPTPTAISVSGSAIGPHITQRFIGDLLPSIWLMATSVVTFPRILNFFRISDERQKRITGWLDFSPFIMGIIAMALGLVHWVVGRSVLF